MAFAIGSKFLGFFREMLIASKFGSGFETDTFFMALSATSLLASLLLSAISTTTIPVLSEVESLEGKEGKKAHTSNLVNIVLATAFILVVLGMFLAPLVIRVVAPGFKGDQFNLAVTLMRIGLPVILFSSALGVFRGYLQSELMFFETAATNLPFNFVYIAFLVFFSGQYGIKGLMVASVLAVGSQLLIQAPGLVKTGYKHKLFFDVRDKYIDKILKLVPPVFISVAVRDLNALVDKSLASGLPAGSISALNYGHRLDSLVLGIFISSLTTVLYPMLAKESNKDNTDGLKKVISQSINIILLITVPATIGLLVLARPVVKVAFERGAFDSTATVMTSGALQFYALGLVGAGLRSLLAFVYYSLQDTRTPMFNSFISVGINIVTSVILVRLMGHKGLALGTSIAAITATTLLITGLRKKIGSFGGSKVFQGGLKCLVAAIAMGLVALISFNYLHQLLGAGSIMEALALFTAVALAISVYVVFLSLFKVEEVFWAIGLVKQKLEKKKQ